MADYTAPLDDIGFVLDHIVDLDELLRLPAFGHIDADTVGELLSEYGRFCSEVFAPLNRLGDTSPTTLDAATGAVKTTPGFAEAYHRYVEGGWGSVPFDPQHGGGGFPWLIAVAMQELLTSSNMAFSLCPLLTQGAIDALSHHGTEQQQETYVRKMVSGEWTGTMNLTEPQAGSDVGALTTRAKPAGDGSWRLFGQKIFITYGEHDLADNIVHLVLARIPDAPAGTKGISLFVVPKFLVSDDGTLGARNDVRCVSIEHKLGIKASPTCTMVYGDGGDGAVGYLVGEPNTGMRSMFTMMNNARLSVGLSGLAMSERAYQDAYRYAAERVQGRVVDATAGETIIGHPDVRRMLMLMRSHIEAMRALCYVNARSLDMARYHPDADERQRHQDRADLLTPLSKGWCTDMGVELTSLAIQVYGGAGYVEEAGVAQHFRDIRIAPIYEGTNGIQALDLVTRKLPLRGGAVVRELFDEIDATAKELLNGGDDLVAIHAALVDALTIARQATQWCLGGTEMRDVMTGATPMLHLLATVVGGWLMARQALAAHAIGDGAAARVVTARFFAEQVLPRVTSLDSQVRNGHGTTMALSVAQLRSH